jgi:hypothetical protein
MSKPWPTGRGGGGTAVAPRTKSTYYMATRQTHNKEVFKRICSLKDIAIPSITCMLMDWGLNSSTWMRMKVVHIYRVTKKSLCTADYNTESYKQCSKCPPPVSRHLLTRRTVSSETEFGTARSKLPMYSVMVIFLRVFFTVIISCTETFWSPCTKKLKREHG